MMKRIPWLVTTITFLLAVSLAMPAGASELQAVRLASPADGGGACAEHQTAPAEDFLFFRYADLVTSQTLDVRVLVGGELFLTEALAVREPDLQADPVVELLSRNPSELALLFAAAEKQPGLVRFELSVDGGPARSLTFEELLAHNRELLGKNLLPQVAVSAVERPGEGEALQSVSAAVVTCDQCWTNYYSCQYNSCVPELPPRFCDRCDTQLDLCLASCEEPPCEPWSEIVYTVVPVSYYSLGIRCFYDVWYPYDPWEFDEQVWTYKQTKIQRTHNCDGTTTDTVLSITYPQDYCYQRWFWDCSGFVWNRLNNCWY
jgi:hypothetical protein